MKSLLVCPSARANVSSLCTTNPLSTVSIFGKTIIEYWLEHLVSFGIRHVAILTADRAEQIRASVGTGSRWGIHTDIVSTLTEPSVESARIKYQSQLNGHPLDGLYDVSLVDNFPGMDGYPLFNSYSGFVAAVHAWMPYAAKLNRIGMRELSPCVWVSTHARVSPTAELRAPCWIGDNTFIGPGTVIGPFAAVEDRVFVERDSEISNSVVCAETFVGALTEIKNSIAMGSLLVNCRSNSQIRVPDPFLLSALNNRQTFPKPAGLINHLVDMYSRNKEELQMLCKHFVKEQRRIK